MGGWWNGGENEEECSVIISRRGNAGNDSKYFILFVSMFLKVWTQLVLVLKC